MPKALIVEILADTKQFGSELDRAAGKTRSFGKAAGVAGLAIAGGLAIGLEKSVKAAEDMQVSTARLDTAFKTAGLNAKDYATQIDHAESSGRNLGFSNIDVRDSLGSLIVATHNTKGAIKDLSTAEDIARFKHVDLADASKMLTMAMAGSQRATKQLGLSLQPVTTAEDKVKLAFKDHSSAAYAAALASAKLEDKQRTAAEVIQMVSDKLHGQASAYADTAQGGVAKMHAQVEALQENLGSALLPALVAVTDKLAALTGWLAQHTTVAKILVGVVATLAAGLLALSAATWAVNVAMDANPIGAVIVAVAALTVGIILLVTHFKQVKEWVVAHWPEVAAVMLLPIAPIISVGLAIYALRDKIKDALESVVNFLRGPFSSAWDAVKGVALHVWDGIKAAWNATIGSEISFIVGLVKTLIHWLEEAASLVSKVAHAASAVGHAITGGVGSSTKQAPGAPPGSPGVPRSGPISFGGVGGNLSGFSLGGIAAPQPQPTSQGGGGLHIHVGPINGSVDPAFARTLAATLATQLRNGGAPQLQQAIQAI